MLTFAAYFCSQFPFKSWWRCGERVPKCFEQVSKYLQIWGFPSSVVTTWPSPWKSVCSCLITCSCHDSSWVPTPNRRPEVLAPRCRAGAGSGKMWKSATCPKYTQDCCVSFFWSSSFFIHIFTFRSYRCYSRDHGSEAISESVPLMCCKRLHVNLCYMWLRQDRLRGKP